MTEEKLKSLSLDQLRSLTEQHRLSLPDEAEMPVIVQALLEMYEDEREVRLRDHNLVTYVESLKFSVSQDEELFIEEGEPLPETYNETRITCLLREPHWALVFWDLAIEQERKILENPAFDMFFLRVVELAGPVFDEENILEYFDIPIYLHSERKLYINLPRIDSFYSVELCASAHDGEKEILLGRSNIVQSTRNSVSEEGTDVLVTTDEIVRLSLTGFDAVSRMGGSSSMSNPHRINS